METLNEIIREEYSDYLRERLIIRSKKQKELDIIKELKQKYEVVELIGAEMYRVKKQSTDDFWGLVKVTGEIVLPQEYEYIDQFEHEHIVVHKTSQLVNALDRHGNFVFQNPIKIDVIPGDMNYSNFRLKFYGQYYTINGRVYDKTRRDLKCLPLSSYDTACYSGENVIWFYKEIETSGSITGQMTLITPFAITAYKMVFPVEFGSKTLSGITTVSHGSGTQVLSAYDRHGKKISNWRENKFIRYIKTLTGYKYYSSRDEKEYKLKHVPIVDLGDYVLCSSKNNSFLYHKKTNMYELFYSAPLSADDIEYENNSLSSKKYNFRYFVLENGIIDIRFLNDEEIVERKKDNIEILSFTDFEEHIKSDDVVMTYIRQKAVDRKATIEQKSASIMQIETDERRQRIINSMELLQQELLGLENFTTVQRRSVISAELLLEEKEGHLEIREPFKKILNYFDLTAIDFTSVNIAGLDLSYSKANINPQKIYNKDMSNGVYKNINFIAFDFTGVNLCGADLSECNLDFAILDGAITDEGTILPETVTYKK